MGLRAVLDYNSPVLLSNSKNIRHIGRVTVKMNGNHSFHWAVGRLDGARQGKRAHCVSVSVDVDKNWPRPGHFNGSDGCNRCVGYRRYPVARPNAQRPESKCNRIGAIGNTDCGRKSKVFRKFLFETPYLVSEDVPAAIQDAHQRSRNFAPMFRIEGAGTHLRDHFADAVKRVRHIPPAGFGNSRSFLSSLP